MQLFRGKTHTLYLQLYFSPRTLSDIPILSPPNIPSVYRIRSYLIAYYSFVVICS